MTQEKTYRLQTNPADFSVLVSAMFTIAREMGANMERTARAPIYFSAHDFATTIVTLDFELLALAEYIPVLIGRPLSLFEPLNNFLKMTSMKGMSFWSMILTPWMPGTRWPTGV